MPLPLIPILIGAGAALAALTGVVKGGKAIKSRFFVGFFRGRCMIPIFLQKTIFRECFVVSQSI